MAENRMGLALVVIYNGHESVLDICSLEKVDETCFIIKVNDERTANTLPDAAGEILNENIRSNIIYNLQTNSPGVASMLG